MLNWSFACLQIQRILADFLELILLCPPINHKNLIKIQYRVCTDLTVMHSGSCRFIAQTEMTNFAHRLCEGRNESRISLGQADD